MPLRLLDLADIARVNTAMTDVAREAIANNDGIITAGDYERVVAAATAIRETPGEAERDALTQPRQGLIDAGIDVDTLQFEPAIVERVRPFVSPGGSEPLAGLCTHVTLPDVDTLQGKLDQRLKSGRDLGTYKDWRVQTPGADVTFATSGAGREWPGLVLKSRTIKDPCPLRDLVGENSDLFQSITSAADLEEVITLVLGAESPYFKALDISSASANEQYAVRNLRRKAFIKSLKEAGVSALAGDELRRAGGVIEGVSIKMVLGVVFNIETGTHTNYWPYWDNYAAPLEKMLGQEEVGSAGFHQIKNRLNDIYRHKTHNERKMREVNERDFEISAQLALVYSPAYAEGHGHRVSLSVGSTPLNPSYELISVNDTGLPEWLSDYAGLQLYRDTNATGTLRVDYMGKGDSSAEVSARKLLGKVVPGALKEHLKVQALSDDDTSNLTLRRFRGGERARKNISFDWGGKGVIDIEPTDVSWWGHCHNSAALNTMAINPQKHVAFYRAHRGVEIAKALRLYSLNDSWDIAGALVADHEGTPEWRTTDTNAPVAIDRATFVGTRNSGFHQLRLTLGVGDPVEIEAEVKSLVDGMGTGQDPLAIYRENVENERGSFGPNPLYVKTNPAEVNEISVDVVHCAMVLEVTSLALDLKGDPLERKRRVEIDPDEDRFVCINEVLTKFHGEGLGGEVTAHYYNPARRQYSTVVRDVTPENGFRGEEIRRTEPVEVTELQHTADSDYQSVNEIFSAFMQTPGASWTYDTGAGKSVWNYAVNRQQLNLLNEVKETEAGQEYTYRTFDLSYSTVGGPEKSHRFMMKFDEGGSVVGTCALGPMPDFAFRQKRIEAAPISTSPWGAPVYNVNALKKGYLFREGETEFDGVETALWQRQAAVLFASLTDKTAPEQAFVFEKTDGGLVSFASEASFKEAIDANKALHRGLARLNAATQTKERS